MSLAKFYHQLTKKKYDPGEEKSADFELWPKEWKTVYFKEYPRLPKISLPKPKDLNLSLGEVLKKRKSEREFGQNPIKLDDLSQLLFYSAGIIEKRENDWNKTRRTYPSGGARFPLEIYPIILSGKDNLGGGIYHYNAKEHFLDILGKKDDLRKEIYPQIIWQEMILKAPLILAVSAVFERNMAKYKERGYRYILFEAGHLGQNIYLVSRALNLKCCAIGGFDDDKFNELLDVDGESEAVLYIFAVGH
jgi:SagB-type dehydrogenase family enzyme